MASGKGSARASQLAPHRGLSGPSWPGVYGFVPVLQLLPGPQNLHWVGTSYQRVSEPKGAALSLSQPPPSISAVQALSQQGVWEVAPVTVLVLTTLLGTLDHPKDMRGDISQAAWAVPESNRQGAGSFSSLWAAGMQQWGPSLDPALPLLTVS